MRVYVYWKKNRKCAIKFEDVYHVELSKDFLKITLEDGTEQLLTTKSFMFTIYYY